MKRITCQDAIKLLLKSVITFIIFCLFIPSYTLASNISYKYDSAGRLTRVDYGNGQSISYIYDKAGNLLQKIVNKSNMLLLIVPAISGAVNR